MTARNPIWWVRIAAIGAGVYFAFVWVAWALIDLWMVAP